MIHLLTKYRISRIAAKEAKGLYGELLIMYLQPSTEGPDADIGFQPSTWMKSVVCNYTNAIEKLLARKNNVSALYIQMKECYVRFYESSEALNVKKVSAAATVSDLDTQIACIELKLTEISQLLNDFHDGKPLPNGQTSRKLLDAKMDLEHQRSQMQLQKSSASDLSSDQFEHDQLTKELREKVLQLESDFVVELDLFYKKIRKTELKYNEQMGYYWQKLCKCILKNKAISKSIRAAQLSEPVKQLADIAPLCNAVVLSKDDLFKNERTYISDTINQAMGIQYEV